MTAPIAPLAPRDLRQHNDPDDICRTCGGSGDERYSSGSGTTIVEACGSCHGTGRRTFVVARS